MRKSSTIILLLFTVINVMSQGAYNDAVKLRTLINNASGKFDATDPAKLTEAASILYPYLKNPRATVNASSYTSVAGEYLAGPNKNLFIIPYLPTAGDDGSTIEDFTGNSLGSIGSTNVTAFADGLAKFLVKRAKQELLVSFFEKFPELEKKYPEMRVVFPNTCELINNFESWEYANIINTLRESFDKDLQEIATNLPKISGIPIDANCKCTPEAVLRIGEYQKFFATNKGLAISASLIIGSQFLSGEKLPEILNNVASSENVAKLNLAGNSEAGNIKSALNFIRIISNSLRSPDATKSYVTKAEIDALLADPITQNLFFGLVYQQLLIDDVTFNTVKVASLLKPGSINGTTTYINNFITQSQQVTNAIKKLNEDKAVSGANLKADWAAIFNAVNNFIPVAANVEVIDARLKLPAGVVKIIEKSKFATAIAHDIAIRNYSAAIVGLLRELHADISDAKTNAAFGEFKAFFVKYGSFAANVAQAKNSDEVEEAIESVALPVGSASIKKKTCFSIAINSYLGGFYGEEYLADKPIGSRWASISGVYAPVGVTFSWSFSAKKRDWSVSGLISVIDIGAVASYRLSDSDAENLPEITLQNIFAPGIGVVLGLPNVPVSVGWTYQLGPALREITTAEAVTDQVNRRWQVFLGVDIPLFSLYTRVDPNKKLGRQ